MRQAQRIGCLRRAQRIGCLPSRMHAGILCHGQLLDYMVCTTERQMREPGRGHATDIDLPYTVTIWQQDHPMIESGASQPLIGSALQWRILSHSPATICSSVVFPVPFAPISRQRLPRGSSRLAFEMKGGQFGYEKVTPFSRIPRGGAWTSTIFFSCLPLQIERERVVGARGKVRGVLTPVSKLFLLPRLHQERTACSPDCM